MNLCYPPAGSEIRSERLSQLTLEDDKTLYFEKRGWCRVAYGVVDDVVVVGIPSVPTLIFRQSLGDGLCKNSAFSLVFAASLIITLRGL